MNYIKSPLNYTGGKYRVIDQIEPLFPRQINTFIDMFCGGGNVFINAKCNSVFANDLCTPLIDVMRNFKKEGLSSFGHIESIIEKYALSKSNVDGYKQLRIDYNETPTWDKLYTLICHSFSNQIRFNKSGNFNMPFGNRTFNNKMKENFESFVCRLSKIDVEFHSVDFRDIIFKSLAPDDFVFVDSPYLNSTATYNENGGWCKEDELDLLILLDDLHKQGVKFGMTNVIEHKGYTNELIVDFSKRYSVYHIQNDYNGCNYQDKNKEYTTREVYVYNY
jgi:DNA adenine methylase Dam